ncbi:MAG: hypothetical protein A4E66_00645 [Syntrophus sp. PtaB.Bin001]|nr:MAG: hypothetical protein A4E66_00645 [Syntrophus sp. PtaB.Bin001]
MPDKAILKAAMKKFSDCLSSELAEDFLMLLLNLMSVVFLIDRDFRKNIERFNGRYLFKSKDGRLTVAALFENDRLKVKEKEIPDADITIFFKDGKALMNYLLSPKPDILGSILKQEVSLDGNLNYLYKFAFMAKRLQLMATMAI